MLNIIMHNISDGHFKNKIHLIALYVIKSVEKRSMITNCYDYYAKHFMVRFIIINIFHSADTDTSLSAAS